MIEVINLIKRIINDKLKANDSFTFFKEKECFDENLIGDNQE